MKLDIKKLSVEIDNKRILTDINISLKSGDMLSINGVNGSGKTTLLKTIMKHFSTKIVSGSILINNKKTNNLSTQEIAGLGIFYIPQKSIELPSISVRSFLRMLNDKNSKLDFAKMHDIIQTTCKKNNIEEELLSRDFNVGFSGGQVKKIEILQSHLFPTKILLVDEIDSGVDVDSLKQISNYFKSIRKNVIIIFISHNIDYAISLSPNKVLVLEKGKIIKTGDKKLLSIIKNKGLKNLGNAT